MIVKNESHVIEKTLRNLTDKINFDYYVICDTGSTDNTKGIIKNFFEGKNIPGEIHDEEWKNFGYNRSKALERAFDKSDLLFIFDADDELHGDLIIPDSVDYDSYHLHFGNGYELDYWRTALVNNRKRWEFVGVLHEYINLIDTESPLRNAFLKGNYYIKHNITGGRSKDPEKYKKDAELLEKAFLELSEDHHLRSRYAFYCANSYRDYGFIDKAIEWYEKTLKLNGWDQEKYRSCIMLYDLYMKKNEYEKAYFYCIDSMAFDKNRVEGIYKLVQWFCCKDMFSVAFHFYTFVQDWYENVYYHRADLHDKLFVDILDYDFYLPYFMIIVSAKVDKKEIGVKMYDMIFTKGKLGPQWYINNLLYNFQF
jgi:tetratricopeptide (TPR) repeat protein